MGPYIIREPVAACDIAKRLKVTRATVSNWQTRPVDFPKPVFIVANGTRVWDWPDVAVWATDRFLNVQGVRI